MISTFIVPLTRVDPAKPEAWPSPEEFMAASLQPPAPAKYLDGVAVFLPARLARQLDHDCGRAAVARRAEMGARYGLSSPRRFGTPPIRTQAFGSADRNPARQLGIIVSNDSYIASVDSVDGRLASRVLRAVARLRRATARDVRLRDRRADVRAAAGRFSARADAAASSVAAARSSARLGALGEGWAPMSGQVYRSTDTRVPREFTVVDTLDERFGRHAARRFAAHLTSRRSLSSADCRARGCRCWSDCSR